MDKLASPFAFTRKTNGLIPNLHPVEAHRLKTNFRQKINTLIAGCRSSGKSSLLESVFAQYNNMSFYRCATVDLLKCRSADDFIRAYLNACLQALIPTQQEKVEWLKKMQNLLSPHSQLVLSGNNEAIQIQHPDAFPISLLGVPEQIAREKNLLLFVGLINLEEVADWENGLSFIRELKTEWSKQQKIVHAFLINTYEGYQTLCKEKNAPLFQFADEIIMTDGTVTDELLQHLMSSFAYSAKSISKEQAGRLAISMSGNPYYLKMLAHTVWENTSGSVTDETIHIATEEMILRHGIAFKKEFSELSGVQKKLVQALAANPNAPFSSQAWLKKMNINSSAAVARAFKGLEKKEVLDPWSEKPRFVNPLFKLWVVQHLQ